jgi:hypothetical protein
MKKLSATFVSAMGTNSIKTSQTMKPTKILACLCLAIALCSTAHAIPVTYTYTGATYTFSELPNEPGCTFSDRIVASFTMDSSFWGMENVQVHTTQNNEGEIDGLINSGHWQVGFDDARVTTTASGEIIMWNLFGAGAGLDIFTHGGVEGAGDRDFIELNRPGLQGKAFIDYQIGEHGNWNMVSEGESIPGVGIPDSAPSLVLLSLAMLGLLVTASRSVR